MILEIILIVLAFIFVLSGIVGVILPFLPSIPLAWIGVLTFAIVTNFTSISLRAILIFSIISLIAAVLEFIAPLIGAKKYQASREGIIGSFVGGLVGFFILGPIGIILGSFSGLVFGEMSRGKNSEELSGVLKGAFVGFLMGGVIKLVFTTSALVYLIIALFKIQF